MPTDPRCLEEIRWAPRVNPTAIRRLYETDARGIVDQEQIDDVGFALYTRCQSILRATEAHNGRIVCPRCGEAVSRQSGPWERDVLVACRRCAWRVRWGEYLQIYQHKHLVGGGAVAFHEEFVARFERARTPQEKMLAIDRLIHAFHWELVRNPGRSAARELIYARNNTELLTFLNTLAYGGSSSPGLAATKARWDEKLQSSEWHQRTGFGPREGTDSPPI